MRNLVLAAGSLAIALGGSAFIAFASINDEPMPSSKGQHRIAAQSIGSDAVDIRGCNLADWSHLSGSSAVDTVNEGCSVVSRTLSAGEHLVVMR